MSSMLHRSSLSSDPACIVLSWSTALLQISPPGRHLPHVRRQHVPERRHWQHGKALPPPSAFASSRQYRIRPLREDELMQAAEIQFEGFHQPNKFQLLDALARMNFRAEVVSTLKQKLKYDTNTPDSFSCLVAERGGTLTGIADVSRQSDREVLRKLPSEEDAYAYLSSMAVDSSCRRQGAAQALLAAAERMAGSWELNYLALHLHDGNEAALRLYQQYGFSEFDRQTPFLGRTRLLMVKPVKR